MKGFAEYAALDGMIAEGKLKNVQFSVVGRWPDEIEWRATRTRGPICGKRLARELRRHHVYMTSSRWEPGGMHHVEGAACGLPVIYHEDGGGINELASRYGRGFRTPDEMADAVEYAREHYEELYQRVMSNRPLASEMCEKYLEVLGVKPASG